MCKDCWDVPDEEDTVLDEIYPVTYTEEDISNDFWENVLVTNED